jgi:hypothetical protein
LTGQLKQTVRRWLPRSYLRRRARLFGEGVRDRAGVPTIARRFVESNGSTVTGGPLAGLEYPPDLLEEIDAPVAKVLGAYEPELHPMIEDALNQEPEVFVDIGAAEGYYAVGFALKSPNTRIHAFEIDGWSRSRLRRLAEINGVADRLLVHKECRAESLLDLPLANAFVLSDCEGAEVRILNAEAARHLADATLLVELHDEAAGCAVSEILRERFAGTHRLTTIERPTRPHPDFPELSRFNDTERRLALEDFRGERPKWAHLVPRRNAR